MNKMEIEWQSAISHSVLLVRMLLLVAKKCKKKCLKKFITRSQKIVSFGMQTSVSQTLHWVS